MRQSGILAAAGLYALQHHTSDTIVEDHRRMKEIHRALSHESMRAYLKLPAAEAVESNILFLEVVARARAGAGTGTGTRTGAGAGAGALLCHALKSNHNILLGSYGDTRVRITTHLGITDADVARSVAAIQQTCLELFGRG